MAVLKKHSHWLVLLAAAALLAQDEETGPPRLKRGRPDGKRETTATSTADLPQVNAPKPPPAEPVAEPAPANARPVVAQSTAPAADPDDPFIERAREAAANFTSSLPNFLCQEVITRYESNSRPPNWKAIDTVSLDLVYEDQKESYRNIKINGKATNKTLAESGGAWSTGEFGTLQANLMDPATDADFRSQGSARINGREAIRYSVAVSQERSSWNVQAEKDHLTVAFKGTVWFERETARVLRIEIEAVRIPSTFGFNAVEWSVDYGYTRVGGAEFLVPTHSETLSCSRGSRFCTRNSIDFRNYRRYGGDSTITFE